MTCLRVVLVDDDVDARALLRDIVQRGGHAVLEPSDDMELEEYASRADAIVLDGPEAARRVRGRVGTSIPMFLLGADGSLFRDVDGIRSFLAKPFRASSLIAALAAVTPRAERRRAPRRAAAWPVEVVRVGGVDRALAADVSEEGIGYRPAGEAQTGDIVEVRVAVNDDVVLEARALVVHADERRSGLSFLNLDPHHKRIIRDYVMAG